MQVFREFGRTLSSRRWAGPLAVLAALLVLLTPAATAAAYLPPDSGWDSHSQLPYLDLFDVSFGDATHGWIVGQDHDAAALPTDFGVIARTSDGGATWTGQTPGTTAILNAVSAVDANMAWAAGAGGAILKTDNGGVDWSPQASGTASDLADVVFSDALHGWAVGQSGTIRATANGGATWNGQASGTTAALRCASFPDSSHGWIVAVAWPARQPSSILATSTGGASWAPQLEGVADEITAVSFPDADHGFAVTFNGVLYSTSNGGATWSHHRLTYASDHPTSLVFVDATHGWAAGGAEDEPWGARIWATSDGGLTWRLQVKGGGPEEGLQAIAVPDLLHGYAVGSSGTVMSTRTGGAAPVTLKLSKKRVAFTTRVTASGRVIPGHEAGDRVTLTVQRKSHGRWAAVTATKRTQTSSGTYSWSYRPANRGAYRMKAAVGETPGHPAAMTTWKNFTVF